MVGLGVSNSQSKLSAQRLARHIDKTPTPITPERMDMVPSQTLKDLVHL
jgi:hypothetical protein